MHFSTISVAAIAVSISSTLVSGTVFQGIRTASDGSTAQVAWTNGTPDVCSGFSTVVQGTSSPCGHDFFVDGGNGPFTLNNCNIGTLELDRSHQFNSVCSFQQTTIGCPAGVKILQKRRC